MDKLLNCSFCQNEDSDNIILAKNFDNSIKIYKDHFSNLLNSQNSLIKEINKLKYENRIKDEYIKTIINKITENLKK